MGSAAILEGTDSPTNQYSRASRRDRLARNAILGPILVMACSWPVQVMAAHTSADANLYACVNLTTKPTPSVTYNFSTQALQCMANIGQNAALTVSQAGVSCAKIGYVQQKGWTTGGDNCYGLNSGLMLLSYNQQNGAASGSVQTDWWTYLLYNNHMRLESASSTYLNVCSSPALCTNTAVDWPWANAPTKDLYVIFQPQAKSSNSSKVDLNTEPVERKR